MEKQVKEGIAAAGKKPEKEKLLNLPENMAKIGGSIYRQDSRSVWIDVSSKDIMKALDIVREATPRISDLSVYDDGKRFFEVMYTFVIGNRQLTIRTRTSRSAPGLPTCTRLFPGALFFEREQFEMFGIVFEGHPRMERLLYAGNTPKEPLKKEGTA